MEMDLMEENKMTIAEVKTKMSEFNQKELRFQLNNDKLKIGAYPTTFRLTEEKLPEIFSVINEYGMFKTLEESYGADLFYKGYTWDDLSNKQKDSVIDYYKSFDKKNNWDWVEPAKYPEHFANNRSFIGF